MFKIRLFQFSVPLLAMLLSIYAAIFAQLFFSFTPFSQERSGEMLFSLYVFKFFPWAMWRFFATWPVLAFPLWLLFSISLWRWFVSPTRLTGGFVFLAAFLSGPAGLIAAAWLTFAGIGHP
jgi:hypothetical protein